MTMTKSNIKTFEGDLLLLKMKTIKKCYNCSHASSAFKIAGITHHQCTHPKHKEGFANGTLSPWDTLQEFYNTCEDHEIKNQQNENSKIQS